MLQQSFKGYSYKGRWKHTDNFHLTLKFLNEINQEQLRFINAAMKNICADKRAFDISLTKAGVFQGEDGMARVLWIGLSGDIKELHCLQRSIDEVLAPAPGGFMPERREYRPHITIGQDILFTLPFDRAREEVYKNFCDIYVQVDRIYLFKSEQVRGKRIYTRMFEYEFGKRIT